MKSFSAKISFIAFIVRRKACAAWRGDNSRRARTV
jgi:hypothetical protein